MATRRDIRNVPKKCLPHSQQSLASNGQASSSSQSQNDPSDRIDVILQNIRKTCDAAAGKKSLKALGKLPEHSSVSYARIDSELTTNTKEMVGTPSLPPMNADNNNTAACSDTGLYIDRHGTRHIILNSSPVITTPTQPTQPPVQYSHPHSHTQSLEEKRTEICLMYLSGRCPRGRRCYRKHPPRSPPQFKVQLLQDLRDVTADNKVDTSSSTPPASTNSTQITRVEAMSPPLSTDVVGTVASKPETSLSRNGSPPLSVNIVGTASKPEINLSRNESSPLSADVVGTVASKPEINLSSNGIALSNSKGVEIKKRPRNHNQRPNRRAISKIEDVVPSPIPDAGSSVASETHPVSPPPEPVYNVPSVSLNRSAVLDDDSKNSVHSNSETGWDCTTDASAWSDASDSSLFSSRSRGSTNTSVAGDEPGPSRPSHESELLPPDPVKYPPPAYHPEVCRKWLRGLCNRAHTCPFVHHDIEYDLSLSTPRKPPTSSYAFTIRDHIKIRLGAGFDVQEIVTGFESPWLHISQLPHGLNADDLSRYLTQRGYPPQDLKMLPNGARVRFSSHIEARNANVSLNGSNQWGVTLSTRLAINNSSGRDVSIKDTVVRLRWQAPGVVAYAGYKSLEKANEALAIARREYPNSFVSAQLYEGLPAVDRYTVRFRNLPINAKKGDMEKYAQPSDVVWDEPNYKSVDFAANSIKRLLEFKGISFLTFDVSPPPYRDGVVQTWVHFSTPSIAKNAATILHNRKPKCTGLTRLSAEHLQSMEYVVPLEEYNKIASDVIALRGVLWESAKRNTTIATRVKVNSVIVTLSADDIKELGQLKADFERIRCGEALRKNRDIVWDGFFAQDNGRMYLRGVEKRYQGVIIKEDIKRRRIMLFGPLGKRNAVKYLLLNKYQELNAMEERIPLPSNLVGPFLHSELPSLRRTLGEDTVRVDMWQEKVIVRGTKKTVQIVWQAVQKVKDKQYGRRFGNVASCPVCFGEVDVPMSLKCGHTYCRACLVNYFNAATENRFFPLTCLGNSATCGERIPLSVPREILSIGEFDNIVEAAFLAYVHTRPKDFHYCPTPDCLQVYRSAPKGTVIQCPSCLLRICPECHVEYHDGFECLDRDSDQSFKEWVGAHDVKNCPSCKIPIERAEGCNHVTCTQCQTHICWVCMETFPRGEGIYSHMRIEHGGIGVAEDFVLEPYMM